MKCLFFDCFSGISGNMVLGSLIDLGVPQKYLTEELKKLGISGYAIKVSRAIHHGISGRFVQVKTTAAKSGHHHRSYQDIEKIISKSKLGGNVKDRSLDIFYRIAKAEAKIHNKKLPEIHFHEVGAIDSIVDIVGSVVGIDFLGIESCSASTVPLGHGFVECQHGTLPVPAPATLLLLKGVPVYDSGIPAELVTPTGAAILTHFVTEYGPMPSMALLKVGYGAGSRTFEKTPNMLRIIIGEQERTKMNQAVRVLEANIDDMNPEWTGYLMDRLFEEGALDVVIIPVHMKKNRPGSIVQVLCYEHDRQKLTRIFFQESTTAGIRSYKAERDIIQRRQGKLKTKFGMLNVKIFEDERGERVVPEFESCKKAARKSGLPLRDIYGESAAAAEKLKGEKGSK